MSSMVITLSRDSQSNPAAPAPQKQLAAGVFVNTLLATKAEGIGRAFLSFLTMEDRANLHATCRPGYHVIRHTIGEYKSKWAAQLRTDLCQTRKELKAAEAILQPLRNERNEQQSQSRKLPRNLCGRIVALTHSNSRIIAAIGRILTKFCCLAKVAKRYNEVLQHNAKVFSAIQVINQKIANAKADTRYDQKSKMAAQLESSYGKVVAHINAWAPIAQLFGNWSNFEKYTVKCDLKQELMLKALEGRPGTIFRGTALWRGKPIDYVAFRTWERDATDIFADRNSQRLHILSRKADSKLMTQPNWELLRYKNEEGERGLTRYIFPPNKLQIYLNLERPIIIDRCHIDWLKLNNETTEDVRSLFQRVMGILQTNEKRAKSEKDEKAGKVQLDVIPETVLETPTYIHKAFGGVDRFFTIPAFISEDAHLSIKEIAALPDDTTFYLIRTARSFQILMHNLNLHRINERVYACTINTVHEDSDKVQAANVVRAKRGERLVLDSDRGLKTFIQALDAHLLSIGKTYEDLEPIPKAIVMMLLDHNFT